MDKQTICAMAVCCGLVIPMRGEDLGPVDQQLRAVAGKCEAMIHAPVTEPAWHARWIGPDVSHLPLQPLAITGPRVWHPESGADAIKAAPVGKRFFRKSIEIDPGRAIASARFVLEADNRATLFINGREVVSAAPQSGTVSVEDFLKPGRNLLAIRAINEGKAPNPAMVSGRLVVTFAAGDPVDLSVDGSWKANDREVAGWNGAELDDQSWVSAKELCKVGEGPWATMENKSDPMANSWICYRATVTLEHAPAKALARIAADSKYWLWINGGLVVREGSLKRGPNPQDGYYDEVDLAAHLKSGANTIAILHWYWGKDGFSHKNSGKPGLVFEAEIDGKSFVSDHSWRMKLHPAFGSTGDPKPNFRLPEHNVRFDARRDIGEWFMPGYDDHAWSPVVERGAVGDLPWGKLQLRPIPQRYDRGLKEYVSTASANNVVTARLPSNLQFTPFLEVEAPAGRLIDIRTDSYGGPGDLHVRAEYVTKEGRQSFEVPGWMNGHAVRYSIPAEVKVIALKYRESGYDTEPVGGFSCSDPFYDKLWQKALRTLQVNMHDNWSDCPDRERGQWWGDVVIDIGESFYAFDARGWLITRKGIRELAGWQRPDKTMFAPIPAGNWDKELPPQILASVSRFGFWTYYRHTGDAETMRAVYPAVKSYLLEVWKLSDDGLVIHRKGGWDWHDWGENIDVPLLDSAWYVVALQGAIEMARLTGNTADVALFEDRVKRIRDRFDTAFWTGTEYRSPDYKKDTDDRGNAMAVLAGLAKPERYAAIRQVLAKHENASPYMEKYVLESLFVMGDPTLALDRMKRRYTRMVSDRPESTLWELFNCSGTNNHAWTGGPFTLLCEYVAGIATDEPAFARFHVRPQLGPLSAVQTRVPTRFGLITVASAREPGRFTLRVRVPEGSRAVAGIPLADGPYTQITVNGKPVAGAAGVVSVGDQDGYRQFQIGAGTWEFVATR